MKGVRFAPSPTGVFHLGNLRTAWVSNRLAKFLNEPWIVRVEDIDSARVSQAFRDRQFENLATLGLMPDTIVTQSENHAIHLDFFLKAREAGLVYPCDCSRREVLESLARLREAPHTADAEYSGRCRARSESLEKYRPVETLAWRWKSAAPSGRNDLIVARTKDDGSGFAPGYHWACAVDDALGDYRILVRAWDLAPVDRVQSEIRNWISNSQSIVFHTALVTQPDGSRLEKRTKGVTLAELESRGFSSPLILDQFQNSFDLKAAVASVTSSSERSARGEARRSLTTSDLGF